MTDLRLREAERALFAAPSVEQALAWLSAHVRAGSWPEPSERDSLDDRHPRATLLWQLRVFERAPAGPSNPESLHQHPWPRWHRRARRRTGLLSDESDGTQGPSRFADKGPWYAPVLKLTPCPERVGTQLRHVVASPASLACPICGGKGWLQAHGVPRVELLPATSYGYCVPVVLRLMPSFGSPEKILRYLETHAAAVSLPDPGSPRRDWQAEQREKRKAAEKVATARRARTAMARMGRSR